MVWSIGGMSPASGTIALAHGTTNQNDRLVLMLQAAAQLDAARDVIANLSAEASGGPV